MPNWLIMVARAVYIAVKAVAARNRVVITMLVGAVLVSSRIGSLE